MRTVEHEMIFQNNIDRIPKTFNKISKENNLYLYGAGALAKEIIRASKVYNFKLKAVCVSNKDIEEEINGLTIMNYSELNKEEPFSIIAGFNILKHSNLLEKLIQDENLQTIYIYDSCYILDENGFDFYPNTKLVFLDDYYRYILKRDLNYSYYKENEAEFLRTYHWLNDEKSKKTMYQYLKGHIELEAFPMKTLWNPKDVKNQYFPTDLISMSDQEVFIDCGAYTGDTLDEFESRVDKFKQYYALEMNRSCFKRLHDRIILSKKGQVVHIAKGAWDMSEELSMAIESGHGVIGKEGNDKVYVDTIDHMIASSERVSFIKMDIEGAELKALHGAQNIIKQYKPKLAICVYHKREDLITIPQFIKHLVPEYKIYLRPHLPGASEVVLYAICD